MHFDYGKQETALLIMKLWPALIIVLLVKFFDNYGNVIYWLIEKPLTVPVKNLRSIIELSC